MNIVSATLYPKEGYAQQINAVGLSIQSSANNMNAAAQQAGDNIYA